MWVCVGLFKSICFYSLFADPDPKVCVHVQFIWNKKIKYTHKKQHHTPAIFYTIYLEDLF